jgi:tRNA G18 (ribose-2'-O)-methylase SpoU
MPIERVRDLDDPRLLDYRALPDPELLRRGQVFVAEGRLVVRTLLESGLRARSILLTEAARVALADVLAPRLADLPVFVVEPGVIESLTGFNIHRGCLAIGERPAPVSVRQMLDRLPGARRVIALEQVGNADNVGATFRNAAAFGADFVLVGPGCCDPLYRKAIRVSMGAALRVPFCRSSGWAEDLAALRAAGFRLAALTPSPAAEDIGACAGALGEGARLVLLAGTEGAGLTAATLSLADVSVRIPLAEGMDSLNVATATAIALYCFSVKSAPIPFRGRGCG